MTSETAPRFSAAKLNKLLFYCDFVAYRRRGRSNMGHSYQKLESGPATEELIPAFEKMKQAGDCAEVERYPFGDRQKRVIARRPAEGSLLSSGERSVADQVVADLWESREDSMCDLSRDFVGWRVAALGEVIPYETSFVGDPAPCPSPRTRSPSANLSSSKVPMADDPVVERLHRQREELMERYQYDFETIIALFKNHEAASTAPLLQPPSATPSVSADRGNGGAIQLSRLGDPQRRPFSRIPPHCAQRQLSIL